MAKRAAIVGAGHNGLVAACVLAGAGWDVTVIERREIAGGACVTEELIPGFRVSTAAYSFSLFRPEIAAALDLAKYGLSAYPKEPRMFVPLPDGRAFFVHRDGARTAAEIAEISPHDADAYPRWNAFWDEVAERVRPMILGAAPSMAEVERALGAEMYRLAIAGSASDTVRAFFDHENVQGAFVGQGIIGTARGPSEEGTAFVMTYHAFGGELVDGAGTWAYVRGGMGGVTSALAACARDRGATIVTGAPVQRIEIEAGRARGVVTEDGRRFDADVVLSNADPKRTLSLADASAFPDSYVERVRGLPTPGSVVKVNLALDELPDFVAAPGTAPGAQHAGTIEISPSIAHLDEAFAQAQAGRVSARPFMEVFIQSVTDDSLAPPGKHVASCFAQYAPSAPKDWPSMREAAGDAVIDMLASYAPNVRGAILHREVLGPPDLEERFGLTGGNIFHGEIVPGQIFGDRFGARTPVAGLYLCGSGAHPGGGVSGAPGWNGAHAVLEDAR
jgi:phytoene dehydrogenase-like protein